MLVPTIIAYDILSYSSQRDFVNSINERISHGWQPLGPVIKYSSSDYYQTLVKYEQPKTNSI